MRITAVGPCQSWKNSGRGKEPFLGLGRGMLFSSFSVTRGWKLRSAAQGGGWGGVGCGGVGGGERQVFQLPQLQVGCVYLELMLLCLCLDRVCQLWLSPNSCSPGWLETDRDPSSSSPALWCLARVGFCFCFLKLMFPRLASNSGCTHQG